MFNVKIPILDAILNVVVVDVNILTAEKLNRRFVVTIDKNRTSVVAAVAKLLKKVVELRSFFCRVRKCYILYLYC
jgi:hypothetical protein